MKTSAEQFSNMTSLPDVTVNNAAAPLSALAAGPNGIMLTAHPGNGGVIIRVSGADVAANKGQPIAAGGSTVLNVSDASRLSVVTESGTGTLCVSQA